MEYNYTTDNFMYILFSIFENSKFEKQTRKIEKISLSFGFYF